MIAYKFLDARRRGLFSGVTWPADGAWMEAVGPPEACRVGVHACAVAHLPFWIDAQLWRIELDGTITELPRMLVAERGRLVEQVEGWDGATMADLARACAERAAAFAEYGADAAAAAARGAVATVCYVAAHAAGIASPDWHAGFAAERAWQARWLTARLGLDD